MTVGVIQSMMPDDERRAAYESDITYGTNSEFGFDYLRDNMAPSAESRCSAATVRDRGRGRLDPDRRGAHAADHLRRAGAGGRDLLRVRAARQEPGAGRGLRGGREAQHRVADRGGRRQDREGARRRQPVRPRERPAGQPPDPGAQGQGAVQARRRVRRARRRGQDRRRVHRPHHGGPPLVGGPAPGGRGQGGRADPGGERDRRHGHDPELLPHVREAGRHDRHRRHRGGRVPRDLRPRGGADPDQRRRSPALDENDLIFKTEEEKFEAVADDIEERNEIGQPVLVGTISVEMSENLSQAARRGAASRTRC